MPFEIGAAAIALPPPLAPGFAREFLAESLGAQPAFQARGLRNNNLNETGDEDIA